MRILIATLILLSAPGFCQKTAAQNQSFSFEKLQQRMLDLQRQIIGHRRTIGLVVGIPVIAEGFALGVEHHGTIIGGLFFFQPPQHIDDAVERARRVAITSAQIRHAVKGTIKVGRTINQQ